MNCDKNPPPQAQPTHDPTFLVISITMSCFTIQISAALCKLHCTARLSVLILIISANKLSTRIKLKLPMHLTLLIHKNYLQKSIWEQEDHICRIKQQKRKKNIRPYMRFLLQKIYMIRRHFAICLYLVGSSFLLLPHIFNVGGLYHQWQVQSLFFFFKYKSNNLGVICWILFNQNAPISNLHAFLSPT